MSSSGSRACLRQHRLREHFSMTTAPGIPHGSDKPRGIHHDLEERQKILQAEDYTVEMDDDGNLKSGPKA